MLEFLKDYGIWLLAVIARGLLVFGFNTGKYEISAGYFSNLLLPVKRRNIVDNGILKSRKSAPPQQNVKGSWYQMLEKSVQETLSSHGDRLFMRDYLRGQELKASEALRMAKK